MRVKATLISLKSKLSKSCNRFVSLFRFRVKRPVFIRPLRRARHGNVKPKHHHHPNKPICSSSLLSCLCFLSTNKDQKMSQTKPRSSSFSVKDDDSLKFMHSPLTPAAAKKLFTSPITTPVYAARTKKSLSSRDTFEDNAVEDSCRNFENYLIHLIVEEGKMDDLMDIEELLFCWKNLKSPVFIELVSRFYGELCRDLFSDPRMLQTIQESIPTLPFSQRFDKTSSLDAYRAKPEPSYPNSQRTKPPSMDEQLKDTSDCRILKMQNLEKLLTRPVDHRNSLARSHQTG